MDYKLTFKQYSEALKTNKLLGLKCAECGTVTVPPKMACRSCSSNDLSIVELKGTGKIQTFTSVFVAAEGRENEAPYTIVMVQMDEGPWLMGNLTGVDPKLVTMDVIGKPVTMGCKVFCGDKYSAGEMARPEFSLA